MLRTISADWLFPGDAPPRPQCYVVIEGERIVAIDSARPQGVPLQRYERCALLPALVNAHTHLEFSTLAAPLEPRTQFAEWIRAVVNWRREHLPAEQAIVRGLQESDCCGVGVLGEIATTDWLDDAPSSLMTSRNLIVFRELLGLRPEAASAQLELARHHLTRPSIANIVRGLSPHAPYSVHPLLLQKLLRLARQHAAPVAMHLAETPEELELLASGSGPLVDLLKDFGAWDSDFIPRGTRPLDYLKQLSTVQRGLVVHGNYLCDEEIDFLTQCPQLSVVYCPRTHAAMGHPPHRWSDMLERGINVCVGTDSRASNPDLSVWEELRSLQHLAPNLAASEVLRLGTANGAQALGLSASCGRIATGSPARLLVVPLSEAGQSDPEQHLFRGPSPKFEWIDGPSGPVSS